ncbi:hypothetical protein [Azospirillum himalayense]|uniref:Uncharacterized protein n=1 Tax=Azospirillum himalayense TaxID=654847 RepID=A0ABW0GBJ0_9PROT
MALTLDDISDASHGERMTHFLHQTSGKTGSSPAEVDHAWRLATEEMLNEAHCMLRHLTGVTPSV